MGTSSAVKDDVEVTTSASSTRAWIGCDEARASEAPCCSSSLSVASSTEITSLVADVAGDDDDAETHGRSVDAGTTWSANKGMTSMVTVANVGAAAGVETAPCSPASLSDASSVQTTPLVADLAGDDDDTETPGRSIVVVDVVTASVAHSVEQDVGTMAMVLMGAAGATIGDATMEVAGAGISASPADSVVSSVAGC